MNKLALALVASTALTSTAIAADITEFRIGHCSLNLLAATNPGLQRNPSWFKGRCMETIAQRCWFERKQTKYI